MRTFKKNIETEYNIVLKIAVGDKIFTKKYLHISEFIWYDELKMFELVFPDGHSLIYNIEHVVSAEVKEEEIGDARGKEGVLTEEVLGD